MAQLIEPLSGTGCGAVFEEASRSLSRAGKGFTLRRMEDPVMEMFNARPADQPVDPVKEMQMRTWARTHYLPPKQRDTTWHPVILDEMCRKDQGR